MKIQDTLKLGQETLKKNKIKTFELDAEVLMTKILDKKREYLILNPNDELNGYQYDQYKNFLVERSKCKPVSYLTNVKHFWKSAFYVSSKVLIPRPDTEIIVKETLNITKNKSNINLLDIGTGTGCIILSILNERKNFRGVALDISKDCIKVCSFNTLKLNLQNRVKIIHCDIDNFYFGKYDIIVSNPPYIKTHDLNYLEKDVKNYEPLLALDGGIEGISKIKKVIKKSARLLKKNGHLILEIAFNQKQQVMKIMRENGFYINKAAKDLGNNDRCIIATKK